MPVPSQFTLGQGFTSMIHPDQEWFGDVWNAETGKRHCQLHGPGNVLSVYRVEIEPAHDSTNTYLFARVIDSMQCPRLTAPTVPRGNRWTITFNLKEGLGNRYRGPLELFATGLPDGVQMIVPPILLTFAEHKASVPSLHWRNDSRVLATEGEDGLLVWWDTVDGWPAISKQNAHPPKRAEGVYGRLRNGVLGASFDLNGNLLTAGRDRVVRLWTPDGQTTKSFEVSEAIPVTPRFSHDGRTLIGGDSLGDIHFWSAP